MADVENNVPAGAGTVYRLASISKPITATAVMQLVERGRVDLDAPVWKYVPAFPVKPWPVTVRQLLCHQSGVRHYRGDEISSTRHYVDLTEPLKIFKDDPLLFEPGTRTSYTTYGYNLLGAVVEAASGMKFADYLEANIFRPAGCDRAARGRPFRDHPRPRAGLFARRGRAASQLGPGGHEQQDPRRGIVRHAGGPGAVRAGGARRRAAEAGYAGDGAHAPEAARRNANRHTGWGGASASSRGSRRCRTGARSSG